MGFDGAEFKRFNFLLQPEDFQHTQMGEEEEEKMPLCLP